MKYNVRCHIENGGAITWRIKADNKAQAEDYGRLLMKQHEPSQITVKVQAEAVDND